METNGIADAFEEEVIFGDGQQSRDFTYVDNVVDGLLRTIHAPAERVVGQVFNLACGDRINLLRLVADLNALTGQNLVPRFEPARTGDVLHSCADIRAAESALGYAPVVDWRTGLERTLACLQQDALTLAALLKQVQLPQRPAAQVGPETVRLSIGLENEADLIADLKQALDRLP